MSSLETEFLTEETSPRQSKSRSSSAILLTCLTGGTGVAISVICLPFLLPALRRICLPYVPATSKQVENVLTALKEHKINEKLVDLGSGDGRIVIAAARQGFTSHGVEMNPWLVIYSRIAALRFGVSSLTSFYCRDLWKTSLVPYNSVVIFGVEEMMSELEQKVAKEVTPGSRVIACRFPLPNKEYSALIGTGIDTVWLYKY